MTKFERPLFIGDAYGGRFTEPSPRELEAERAIHDVYEAVARLWELVPPQTADWTVLSANIQADRNYRQRSRRNV